MGKKPDLQDVLRNAGGGTRGKRTQTVASDEYLQDSQQVSAYQQPSRVSTRAITVHMPPEVRQQLKVMAAEQNVTMQSLLAEAMNDLFAKYGKPEIAPTQSDRE